MNEKQSLKINKIKDNQLRLQDSFRACFDTSDGKAVLKYLKKKFFYRKTTVVFGPTGVENTFYNNGQRDVVNAIDKFIHADKEEIINTIEENYYERSKW